MCDDGLLESLAVIMTAIREQGAPCVVLRKSRLIFDIDCGDEEFKEDICQECLGRAIISQVDFNCEFGTEH